jgi:hypothetical protein
VHGLPESAPVREAAMAGSDISRGRRAGDAVPS